MPCRGTLRRTTNRHRRPDSTSRSALRPSAICTARARPPVSFSRSSRRSRNRPTCSCWPEISPTPGQPEEARSSRARTLGVASARAVAVLGNHDCESGRQEEVVPHPRRCRAHGARWRGVRSPRDRHRRRERLLPAGSAPHALGPWGEPTIKQFVHEAVNEALKLEASLARLRTREAGRAAALLPHSADRRRRASRNLSLRRLESVSRSRSLASPCRWSCTDTRIAVATKGVPRTTCRSTTCRCRF